MNGPLQRKEIDPLKLGPIVIAKWQAEILTEGFVPLPKKLLRTMRSVFTGGLAMMDLSVVLAVVDFKRPNLSMQPSLEYLAFTAGIPPPMFWARLQALQERGLVTIEGDQDNLKIGIDGLLQQVEDLAGSSGEQDGE